MNIQEFFRQNPRAAMGLSGGVDSAYLLYAGLRAGGDIRPYFVKTPFQPGFELADAQRLADSLGAGLTVVETDVLACPEIAANPADRCYHCKAAIFGALREAALRDGYTLLLDGTNASDEASDRPGMRALAEMGVRSPLRECGLTKGDIRRLSREAGLFTWDKPAYACLATRLPTGERLTREMLERVEMGENALFSLGFSDFRVRVYHGAARLQLPQGQMAQALARREEILRALHPYFETVFLDLKGRN